MKKRVYEYDAIRTIATIAIIICHQNAYITGNMIGDGRPIFWPLIGNIDVTALGVSLFFILSGASLMLSYNSSDLKFNAIEYYKKRFWGIVWPFYFAWSLILAWSTWNGWIIQSKPIKFIYTIFAIDGWISEYTGDNYYLCGEWFLGCIIFIYLFFPIMRKLAAKKSVFFISIVLSYVVGILFCEYYEMNTYTFPLVRLFEFGMGMLFTEVYLNSENPIYKRIILIVSLIIFMFVLLVPLNIYFMHKYILCSISAFCLLYEFNKILCNLNIYRSICSWFAGISYCCFLLHHHILASFAEKYFGVPISIQQKNILFYSQMVAIVIAGYVLKKVSQKTRLAIKQGGTPR